MPVLPARERFVEHGQLEGFARPPVWAELIRLSLVPRVTLARPPVEELVAAGVSHAPVCGELFAHQEVGLGEAEHVNAETRTAFADASDVRHADASRPAGGAAVFAELLAQPFCFLPEDFGGERTVPHTRGHELEHADVDDVPQAPDAEGRPRRGGGAARLRAQRIEERALSPLEQDVAAAALPVGQVVVGALDACDRLKPLAPLDELAHVVLPHFMVGDMRQSSPEQGLIQAQLVEAVRDGDAPLPSDVFVRGRDATSGGTDAAPAHDRHPFGGEMPRAGDGGVGVDDERLLAEVDALLLQSFNFFAQPARTALSPLEREDDAVRADETGLSVQDGDRHHVRDELDPVDDHRVPRVAAAVEAGCHEGVVVSTQEFTDVRERCGLSTISPLHVAHSHSDPVPRVDVQVRGAGKDADEVVEGVDRHVDVQHAATEYCSRCAAFTLAN